MRVANIDIETRARADLRKVGVYRYTECPDFKVLMLAIRIDGGEIMLIDFTKPLLESTIVWLKQLLTDPAILKTAHNANFERTALAKELGLILPPEQWECTMVKAAMCGLPLSLDAVAKALRLADNKDAAGKALINYFCKPCNPTKSNGFRQWNTPGDAPEKWEQFCSYCVQDVQVESSIRSALSYFNIPAEEMRLWYLDQKINDRGVLLDPELITGAIEIEMKFRDVITAEAIALTGLENPNSVQQLTKWLSEKLDREITTLRKEDVIQLLKDTDITDIMRHDFREIALSTKRDTIENSTANRVLKIRAMMSKTSLKKYPAMVLMKGADNRFRGSLQFYGANRTGRFAGRGIQIHNLPKNKEKTFGKRMQLISAARDIVKAREGEMLECVYGSVQDVLSQLLRTAFIASPGKTFMPADFSAIEARVIAWLAGEQWRIDVFNGDGKIYEASAAKMFKVPIELVVKGSKYRDAGKVAELACGFQGGEGALIRMGALEMGLTEDELPGIKDGWRAENRMIVKLWSDLGKAAIAAVKNPGQRTKIPNGLIRFQVLHNTLWMKLPSGRCLAYYEPRLLPGKYGEVLTYKGLDQEKKTWGTEQTYGGKLAENATQAIARDCLREKMFLLDDANYDIVAHVHDEIIPEVPIADIEPAMADINRLMSLPISWAPGLPLHAESYATPFYMKED